MLGEGFLHVPATLEEPGRAPACPLPCGPVGKGCNCATTSKTHFNFLNETWKQVPRSWCLTAFWVSAWCGEGGFTSLPSGSWVGLLWLTLQAQHQGFSVAFLWGEAPRECIHCRSLCAVPPLGL